MRCLVFALLIAVIGCVEDPVKNENAVERALNEIFSVQEDFRHGCIKDRDPDGVGEFGFLFDLARYASREGGPPRASFLNNELSMSGPSSRYVLNIADHTLEILMQDRRGFNVWDMARSDIASIDFQEGSYLVSAVPRVSDKHGRYCYVMDQRVTAMKFPFEAFKKEKRPVNGGIIALSTDENGVFSIDAEKAKKNGWQAVSFR